MQIFVPQKKVCLPLSPAYSAIGNARAAPAALHNGERLPQWDWQQREDGNADAGPLAPRPGADLGRVLGVGVAHQVEAGDGLKENYVIYLFVHICH